MADKAKPPAGLRAAGKRLWSDTLEDFDLAEHERGLLLQACRTADSLDELQKVLERDGVLNESSQGTRVHPALPELRQQRITFARLVAALGLESGVQEDEAPKQQRRSVRGTYGIKGVVS
ncbi:P27 family phage terminase small subunit [Rhodococcus sp. HS-D2]|uniref:P27 family phage terminase small subunit n=1 Tax=Rhodococcus sp. HS-D2 TaxID=1384636 RepID=UPI000AA6AB7A|nr:P27 family phage terminase small subunit [Rhodococcus sp. HS-D2]